MTATCAVPVLFAALGAPSGGGGDRAVLAEGVLSGGRAARVLAAVSQHALIAAAATAVVEQGRLAHGRGELSAQNAAVEGKTRLWSKVKLKRKTL